MLGHFGNTISAKRIQDRCCLGKMHERGTAQLIIFLGSESEEPADLHHRLKRQYGDTCVTTAGI